MNQINNSGIGTAGVYALMAVAVGIGGFLLATILIPRLLARFSPHIDEQREILRGNQAVAEYFGRIASACILGVSIIIAAALVVAFQ